MRNVISRIGIIAATAGFGIACICVGIVSIGDGIMEGIDDVRDLRYDARKRMLSEGCDSGR